jgi:hypothetical protein
MILTTDSFVIFKNDKKTNEKAPDYRMLVKFGEGKFIEVAGVWLKEGAKGKFFSGKMKKAYGDSEGYLITTTVKDPQTVSEQNELESFDASKIAF